MKLQPTRRSESERAESHARPAVPRDITEHQLTVALTWHRRGLPVVPCSRTDKGAMVAGFGAAATPEQLAPFVDEQQVRQWWTGRFRRAHVGILGGRATDGRRGLVVVDLDMSKTGQDLAGRFAGCLHGSDVLELLMREAGAEWPDTYTVETPSGGMHLYYRQPDDGPVIGCATGDGATAPHIGPLVDVRGIGGYVIAAGSYSSAQGRAYERISLPEMTPQPVPAWLLAIMRRPAPARPATPAPVRAPLGSTATRAEKYAAAALEAALEDVRQAPAGTGNDRLNAVAYRLGRLANTAPRVLDKRTVEDKLVAAAIAQARDWPAAQVERKARNTIKSGWTAGTANPKTTTTAGAA